MYRYVKFYTLVCVGPGITSVFDHLACKQKSHRLLAASDVSYLAVLASSTVMDNNLPDTV